MEKIKLKPLTQFYCDECGGIIENPRDGYVEWEGGYDEKNGKHFVRGFRIIHRKVKSPCKGSDGCYKYGRSKFRLDNELTHILEYSKQRIFSWLDRGFIHDPDGKIGCEVIDMKSFVDFAKRLTIPYYEEARIYFEIALQDGYFSDCNEVSLYSESALKAIIERYSDM